MNYKTLHLKSWRYDMATNLNIETLNTDKNKLSITAKEPSIVRLIERFKNARELKGQEPESSTNVTETVHDMFKNEKMLNVLKRLYTVIESDPDYNPSEFTCTSLLETAVQYQLEDCVDAILKYTAKLLQINDKNKDQKTVLLFALSQFGNPYDVITLNNTQIRIILRLLRAGADPSMSDSKGNTALHYAAFTFCPEIIDAILNTPTILNTPNGKLLVNAQNARMEERSTPLISLLAIAGRNLNTAYNPNHPNYKNLLKRYRKCLELLVKAGADVNFERVVTAGYTHPMSSQISLLKEPYRSYPLHTAAQFCGEIIIRDLIDYGVKLNAKDSNGEDALRALLRRESQYADATVIKTLIDLGILDNSPLECLPNNSTELDKYRATIQALLPCLTKEYLDDMMLKILVEHWHDVSFDFELKNAAEKASASIFFHDFAFELSHEVCEAASKEQYEKHKKTITDTLNQFKITVEPKFILEILKNVIQKRAILLSNFSKLEAGQTVLHKVAQNGSPEQIQYILSTSIGKKYVSKRDNQGYVPFELLLSRKGPQDENFLKCFRVFLEYGYNTCVTDETEKSLLTLVSQKYYSYVIQSLSTNYLVSQIKDQSLKLEFLGEDGVVSEIDFLKNQERKVYEEAGKLKVRHNRREKLLVWIQENASDSSDALVMFSASAQSVSSTNNSGQDNKTQVVINDFKDQKDQKDQGQVATKRKVSTQ